MTLKLAIDEAKLLDRYPVLMGGDWRARLITVSVVAALAVVFACAFVRFQFSANQIGAGLMRMVEFAALMVPPNPGSQGALFLEGMGETLAMAFLGTLLAAALAFPLGLMAARNILPNVLVHFLTRRGMDTARSIDTLIWALIWINVVGLGPFAGMLAIATTDLAALAKLFAEACENADRKAPEGVIACGGGPLARIRFGLLPQVLPVMASQILYFFESNTRSATIVGIVGAGGVGLYITEAIRTLDWDKVSFLVLLIFVTVGAIDFLSSRLRRAMGAARVAPG